MKKMIILSLTVVLAVFMFQGCESHSVDKTPEVGVIKFDSKHSGIITGYDFSIIDTIGGFTFIPLGFEVVSVENQPFVLKKHLKWIKEMLIVFQKEFNVKVTNYQEVFAGESQLYLKVFFEPVVNPEIKALQSMIDSLQTQNGNLQSSVDVLKISLNQTKKQLIQIKKTLEEKK